MLYSGVVPAAVAAVVMVAVLRLLPEELARRYAAPLAFAAAAMTGYVLLPAWAPLVPTRHWQWPIYLGSAAGLVAGSLALAAGVYRIERWLLHILAALLAALLLVPTWEDLDPARGTWIAIFTLGAGLLSVLLDALPERLQGRRLLTLLTIVATAGAVVLAAQVSLKFGQLGVVVAAALLGCTLGSLGRKGVPLARAILPAYTIATGGLALAGHLELFTPHYELLAVPAMPLALWLCVYGPLARFQGRSGLAVQLPWCCCRWRPRWLGCCAPNDRRFPPGRPRFCTARTNPCRRDILDFQDFC
ncbi:MAG: hypothetical protein WDZ59_16580 [Pirellulales bacterium]